AGADRAVGQASRSSNGARGCSDRRFTVGIDLTQRMNAQPEILFDRRGSAGIVTLNRSEVLNAVTHNMVRQLAEELDKWKSDGAITRVVIRAKGARAFSAGGDLREVTDQGQTGNQDEALVFFRNEYLLNTAMKLYPKP